MASIDPRLRDLSSANALVQQQHQQQHQPLQQEQQQQSPQKSTSTSQAQPALNQARRSPYIPIYTTPQSTGAYPDNTGGSQDGNNDANDSKKSRACEACRGLKVRCEPDLNNPDAPCKRCAKANRNCVVTLPTRKRQKKTDSRVAELEKKINALTASLQAQGAVTAAALADPGGMRQPQAEQNLYQQITNGGYGTPYDPGRPEERLDDWHVYPRAPEVEPRTSSPPPPMVGAGQKRKHADSFSAASNSHIAASAAAQRQSEPVVGTFHTLDAGTQKVVATQEYTDVVDKGLVTVEEATKMFNWYVEKMAPHMPSVVFPPGTTAAEIRNTKPILFLAILSASAGVLNPEKQRLLTKEVMSIYADRIICSGDKTLELIQALIVSCLWYWPPEHFEELKFYQLIHIASVMAIDMGMNKKSRLQKNKVAGLFRDNPWRRTPFPDPESLESRRTWLSCYFLCCNASMGLRRPNLVRWTSFMTECLEVLETSPDALPSDKTFCQWIRSQHIAEDIGTRFSMDDPSAKVSMADTSVQHALTAFEIELEEWSNQIPPGANSSCLQITEHVVNLYMHEVAMHVDHNVEEFKPPFTDAFRDTSGDDQKLSSSHVKALSVCLKSIDGIFATFLGFDVETIRCLPVANFVRVAYAVVVLIKMYFAAANPNSNFGKVINKDNMKVEQYLDGLVSLFMAAALEEKSRPSQKFLLVLLVLKTWFHRQREEKTTTSSSNDTRSGPVADASTEAPVEPNHNSQVQQQRQISAYSPANNSLQLLSEVATGSGGQSRSGSISNYPGSNDWQTLQYNNSFPMNQAYGNGGGQIDPRLGMMDFNYSMGDGLEQAMGMTLGVGEYSIYFGDNSFMNGFMGLGDFGDGMAQNIEGGMQ
ncbi:uncharacterized protein L3040_009031 [Drepanopeziza brunnea f. sp. 'multigermtubi']|uniref:uncharacterized protein n=1 Tax=Drepanopeziza brunnea f. sp. 'multigermtubi' TaxID=698441 RepID=UPI0023883CDA|nr:hypothetical protein L3040_009031 [Drepanopeziza brunnea f. sp. 'multigermtubi']